LKIIQILVALLLICSGCLSADQSELKFNGEAIEPSMKVDDFTLFESDQGNWTFSEETEGKVTVIAFLFTNCLDVCPIVTSNMHWMFNQLTPEEHNETQFITMTVDPWRDDAQTMSEWKMYRETNWPHLTTNSTDDTSEMYQTMMSVWFNFEVGLFIEETSSNESSNTSARHHPDAYNVNHSTGTVLVDKNGYQRVWWGDNDWVIDLVLADVRTLLAEEQ
jgi:protein SCO1/2